MSEFWKIKSKVKPDFDGGLVHNKFIEAGIFIVPNIGLRNAIGPLYRGDENSTTMAFVTDGSLSKLYLLLTNPTTQTTQDSDWVEIPMGNASVLKPKGTWDADNTNPILQDTDAIDEAGDFYNVTGAPSPIVVQYTGLFNDVATTVKNGDIVISNDVMWYVSPAAVTWESLNVPQVLLDYVNGTVIAHVHEISGINGVTGLQIALDEKYDVSNVADFLIDFALVPDDKLVNVAFLKQHYYKKDETYDRDQVDALIGVRDTTDFDWNRPTTKSIEAGEIINGDTIEEGLETGFFGPLLSEIEIISIAPLEIGALIAPTVKGVVTRNGADLIQSITIVDSVGIDVGSPTFTGTDAIIEFDFQVDTAIQIAEGSVDSYKIVVESVYNGNPAVSTETTLLAITPIYPILYGIGASGLSATDRYTTLTKLIETDDNKSVIVNSNLNRIHYGVPIEYVDRISINNASEELLGSLFPLVPITEQVDSVGLTIDWSHNYKWYESNYNTDSNNATLSFLINLVNISPENTLDDITEGIINKHLTKTLKEKLVNFNAADYLNKSTYDTDDNGVVEFAAQMATNGKNTSGAIIPNLKLVHITGANPVEEVLEIELADASSNKPCNAITLESIAIGSVGRVLRNGFAVPINLPGGVIDDIVYLDGLGDMQLSPPASGLLQTIGIILAIDGSDDALIGFNPQDLDDRSDFLRDWRAFTPYQKDVQLVVSTDDLPNVKDGWNIIIRVATEDYTSSNNVTADYNAGDLEIVGGGDMHSIEYDPNNKTLDVYDMDSMDDGLTEVDPALRKVTITENQRIKLDGLEQPTFKGTFATPTTLRAAHDNSGGLVLDGYSANVVSTSSTWIWDSGATPTPPTVGGDWVDSLAGIGGDMLAATYDNAGKGVNIYDVDNHDDGTTNKVYSATDKTKLAGIETNAKDDQTALEIKTAYESNANSNEYSDAEQTKLSNIEVEAKDDQNSDEVPYDPTGRAFITAIEVQGAFDELDSTLNTLPSFYLDKAVYDTNENGISDSAETLIVKALNDEAVPVTIGQVVYLNRETVSDKFFKLSSNNDFTTLPVSGFLLDDAIAGAEARIAVGGIFTVPSFVAAVADDLLYLTIGGSVSVTKPAISNTIAHVIPGRVLDVIGGNQIIEVTRKQHSTADDVTIDNTTSTLIADTVQNALVELANKTDKVMGTLSYNSVPGVSAVAGEITLPATLSAFSPNTSTPANGRLAVDINSDVTIQIHISSRALANNDSSEFELAINGVGTGIFAYRSIGGTQLQGESASMSHTLQLTAADYISVLLTGNTVDVHAMQITINGNKT